MIQEDKKSIKLCALMKDKCSEKISCYLIVKIVIQRELLQLMLK